MKVYFNIKITYPNIVISSHRYQSTWQAPRIGSVSWGMSSCLSFLVDFSDVSRTQGQCPSGLSSVSDSLKNLSVSFQKQKSMLPLIMKLSERLQLNFQMPFLSISNYFETKHA